MPELRNDPEGTENTMLKDSNPDHAEGVFSKDYGAQFHFGVQGGPHPNYTVRFDWADGQSCTWMRKIDTPRWVSDRELSEHEGLFQDSYGNMILFLHISGMDTARIFRRWHRRNNGWTLLPPTVHDI